MEALHAEIRAERKARRDEWLAWIPLLALVVSLISALTALVVVWKM
jgi:CHASE1-domain containing sensor protein